MRPHQGSVEGEENLPRPAGHTLLDASSSLHPKTKAQPEIPSPSPASCRGQPEEPTPLPQLRPALALSPVPRFPSCRKRGTRDLHEDRFDGVLDVAVRRSAQQLPQTPLRQLRRTLLLLLGGLQRGGGAAAKAEEGDESGAESAAAAGEKRHRARLGTVGGKWSWDLPAPRAARGRGLPLAQPTATPQQPHVTLPGRWGSSIPAEPSHKALPGLSRIREQHGCTGCRGGGRASTALLAVPGCARQQGQPPQPWDCEDDRGARCWRGNHRITESQNSRGWKGPLWVI